MTLEPITTRRISHEIGKLCVGGDWACAQGDLDGLRHVVQQLAAYVPEPLHCELERLASDCGADPDRATALWDALKDRLYREARA
jgi:hypothetical protein